MIDKTLINRLTKLAKAEEKLKGYKRRLRVKGKIINKTETMKGNLTLTIKNNTAEYKFTVLQSHTKYFALAHKLIIGSSIAVEGIPKFRFNICTKLKQLDKGLDSSIQTKLG